MRGETRTKPKSDYTFIRVRLPDGSILQVIIENNNVIKFMLNICE